MFDLQKAGLWKRVTAGIFDGILTSVLAVGLGFVLSLLLGYGGYNDALQAGYDRYEAQYGVTFEQTQEELASQSPQERERYEQAYQALIADKQVLYNYNMTVNLTLVITTVSILVAVLAMEFVVPLLFGNGQTLGKKIFGLCLMRNDGVKVNNLQLFTRAILGKFTVETMMPVNIIIMILLGLMDITGSFVLLALLIGQCVCYLVTRTNSLLHDLLAGTVVVDYTSQMIFASTEALIAYQKQVAADRAARENY